MAVDGFWAFIGEPKEDDARRIGDSPRTLFGLKEPAGDPLVKAEAAAKSAKRQQLGDKHTEWALDQVGTDIVFANRTEMPTADANSPRIK